MRKAIIALLLAVTCVAPALAQSDASLEAKTDAFNSTTASNELYCPIMERLANQPHAAFFPYKPTRLDSPYYAMVAGYALQCLHQVEKETSDDLPSEVPRTVFLGSCFHVMPFIKNGMIVKDQTMTKDQSVIIARACNLGMAVR